MGLSAGEVTAKIHLNWCGKDDVKFNFFSQEPYILLQSKFPIQVRCPEMLVSLLQRSLGW